MRQLIKGLVVCMALNGGAIAAGTDAGMTNPDTGLSNMTGTVESIDQSGNRVRIRNAQGQINEYSISKETTFTSNGQSRKFTDVQAGDTVRFESNPELGIINFDFGPTTVR